MEMKACDLLKETLATDAQNLPSMHYDTSFLFSFFAFFPFLSDANFTIIPVNFSFIDEAIH